jgi:Fur family ferric uptake transcriptional regulator
VDAGGATGPRTARSTRQGALVAELLSGAEGLVSAQDLHAVALREGRQIGLSTVYRQLHQMAHRGDADAVRAPSGEELYRACSAPGHQHLICRLCGTIRGVPDSALEGWGALVGVCPACVTRSGRP